MSAQATIWEQGRETGSAVIALGAALALTAVAVEIQFAGGLGWFFDLSFVLVSLLLALSIRPGEFFTAGVLPPLLMLGVFVLLALAEPTAIAAADGDSAVQAVVAGLSSHSIALLAGYGICLVVLIVRSRVERSRLV